MAIEKKFPRKLNESVDSRLRKGDEMIDAMNIQAGGDTESTDFGGDTGVVKPVNGNTPVQSLAEFELDENRKVIGKVEDQKYRRIYLFVWCSNKNKEGVYSYDSEFNTVFPVYTSNYFNFDQNGFVKGDVVHLTDQAEQGDEKTYLYFTDNVNEPRRLDVSRADINQTDYNNFDFVDFITACPTSPQKPIEFEFAIDAESSISALEGTSGFQFAYQNMYYSGEISSPSVHSDIAVPPAYLQQGTKAVSDLFMENIINLTVPRNGYTREVEKVRILVRYGNQEDFFIVDDVDVNLDGDTTYQFRNNRILSALTKLDSTQQFDALPRQAESQSVMEDRLFYGNYVEGRDRTETTATLSVGFNARPQELIEYNIKVDEEIFEIPPTTSTPNTLLPELNQTRINEVRNRMAGFRLGFGQIPEVIPAGSDLTFELSFAPSRNWHLYNGYNSPLVDQQGETIHGSKRVYIPNEDYGRVSAQASSTSGFMDTKRRYFGKASLDANRINDDGVGGANTVRWRSTKGDIGNHTAVYGTSALNPLIVKGGSVNLSISLRTNININQYELRRVIMDALSNRTDTNITVGYNLVDYEGDDPNSKVTVISVSNSDTYSYNLGLDNEGFIENTQNDSRSQLVVAVGDQDSVETFGVGVPPCGYFIINRASVLVGVESLYEYEDGINGSEGGFIVPYIDAINPAEGNGVMTCIPDAPFPHSHDILSEEWRTDITYFASNNPSGSFPLDGDTRVNGWYTFTREFLEDYQIDQTPNLNSQWQNPEYVDSTLLGTKGRDQSADFTNPFTPEGAVGSDFTSYISSLISNVATTSLFDDIAAAADEPLTTRARNELFKIWGYLDFDNNLYHGPSYRASQAGVSVGEIIRNGFVSIVDGEGGPGGSYRTRVGSILSLCGHQVDDRYNQWSSTFSNFSPGPDGFLNDLRDTLEYEGSVHLGTVLGGVNTAVYRFMAFNTDGNEDSFARLIAKSVLPNWGFSKWNESDISLNSPDREKYMLTTNYYGGSFGGALDGNEQPISSSLVTPVNDFDGYVGHGGTNEYAYGYGNYPAGDGSGLSANLPGLPRYDSELFVLKNRYYSSSFNDLSGRTFKSNSYHDFGIVYYDHRGRPGPVNRIGSIYVPGYSSAERNADDHGSSYIDISLTSPPPAWAFDYQIVYSGRTSVSDFVQYTSGGAFAAVSTADASESQGIYVSLNYLQGKPNISYTNEFGAKNPVGEQDLYNYKPGDRLRIISYYESEDNRVWPLSYEFDVVDFTVLSNDVENNPLYDPAIDGNEVPESKTGSFLILRNSTDADGFTYTEVANNDSLWNHRCVFEIFSPLKDQDTDDRPYYEISQSYPVVYIDGVLRHREEDIRLTEGDVWWRLMAVNMPNFESGNPENIVETGGARFRPYYLESQTFSDQVTGANVSFFGKPKFFLADEGEVRRRSSITFGDRNAYSQNIVQFTNFNPNAIPFKDLSNKYGAINYLENFDEFLLCMQENKVSRLPISRNIITDVSGNESLVVSTDIVGTPSFYSGSFGTDNNPESVTVVDNDVYFVHKSKKEVLRFNRLEGGIRPISDDGMDEFFDQQFEYYGQGARYVTGYDPDNKEMLLSMSEATDLAQDDSQFINQPSYTLQTGFDPGQVDEFTNPCEGFEVVEFAEVSGNTISDTGEAIPSITSFTVLGVAVGDVSIAFEAQGQIYYPEAQNNIDGIYQVNGLPTGSYPVTVISGSTSCESTIEVTVTEFDGCDVYGDIAIAPLAVDNFAVNTDTGSFVFGWSGNTPFTFTTNLTYTDTNTQVSAVEPVEYTGSEISATDLGLPASSTLFLITGLGAGDYELDTIITLGTGGKCFHNAVVTIAEEDPCSITGFESISSEGTYSVAAFQTITVTLNWFGVADDGISSVNQIEAFSNPSGVGGSGTVSNLSTEISGTGQFTTTFDVQQVASDQTNLFLDIATDLGCPLLNISDAPFTDNPWPQNPCTSSYAELTLTTASTEETYQGANDGQIQVFGNTGVYQLYQIGVSPTPIQSLEITSSVVPIVFGGLSPGAYYVMAIDGDCEYPSDTIVLLPSDTPPPVDPGPSEPQSDVNVDDLIAEVTGEGFTVIDSSNTSTAFDGVGQNVAGLFYDNISGVIYELSTVDNFNGVNGGIKVVELGGDISTQTRLVADVNSWQVNNSDYKVRFMMYIETTNSNVQYQGHYWWPAGSVSRTGAEQYPVNQWNTIDLPSSSTTNSAGIIRYGFINSTSPLPPGTRIYFGPIVCYI